MSPESKIIQKMRIPPPARRGFTVRNFLFYITSPPRLLSVGRTGGIFFSQNQTEHEKWNTEFKM